MSKESCNKRIALALIRRNMKQSELCQITGIPKSAMSQYIKGSFEPKQGRLNLIAKALNVSEAWLMGYDVPMTNENIPEKINRDLTTDENELLSIYRKLNCNGKEKVIENAKDISMIPKYSDKK